MKQDNPIFRFLSPILIVLTLLLSGWAAMPGLAQTGGPFTTFLPVVGSSAAQLSVPPPDLASQRLTVPPGFAIRIFAQGLNSPRLLTPGPDGAIYAASINGGLIYRFPDANGDGLADTAQVAASGLTAPNNVAFFNGWMYVAENGVTPGSSGKVERFFDNNHDGVYETRQLVTENIPGPGGHVSRTIHFGPDGKMYVSVGSSCNLCVETDPRRAAILRFNPDGSIPADNPFANDPNPLQRPVWAWGLRNSVDFFWSPARQLWANMMGSDQISDVLPPEEILIHVRGGLFYGWPYCYTPGVGINEPLKPEVADPRLAPPPGFTCGQAVPAKVTAPAHSAPLGMALESNSAFPADYKGNVFIAYHGSWNTTDPANYRDCKVERVNVQNRIILGTETFVNGWRAPGKICGDPAGFGRPAGVTFGSDGAMYISDDLGGRIYRVVYVGP